MKDSTFPTLLQNLFELLEAFRPTFRQERTFLRAFGLLLGELFVFARHTVTQELLALGLTDADWSAWYRLFSRNRFQPEAASQILFRETLQHVPAEQAYVIGADAVQVPRHSLKMPGTSWLKAAGTGHRSLQTGYPSSAALSEFELAGSHSRRLQSGDPTALAASLSGQSCCGGRTTPEGMGSRTNRDQMGTSAIG